MFIIFFSLFILLFTIFESFTLGLIVGIISIFGIGVYLWITGRKTFKIIGICLLSCVLSIISVLISNYRYDRGGEELLDKKVFIGSGQIQDLSSPGKYIFSDGENTYSVKSSKKYDIGDRIWLVGNMQPVQNQRTPFSSILSFGWSGLFHHEFNYDKRLKMKGFQASIFENNSILLLSGDENDAIGFIPSMRKGLQSLVKKSYGETKIGGLVLGMLIGDRSKIPPEEYQTFIDSGLVHLIAVSGGNIVMIVVFLGFVLLRIPFYLRNFIILITIVIYGFLCGMDSSVFRAVVMGGLGMTALFRGREISVRRLMGFAFVGMLVINPYFLVYDVGFIFSFSAIVGLVYFSKQLPPSKISYIRNNYLSPSIGATIGIFPSMIFFMGKINLIGILGNLFVLPIVPIVMIYGFISTILYQLIPRIGFIKIEEQLIRYVYWISKISADFGVYINVEGDRIKRSILIFAVIWFISRRMGRGEK